MAAPQPKPSVNFEQVLGQYEFTNQVIIKPLSQKEAAEQGLTKNQFLEARTRAVNKINQIGEGKVYYNSKLDHYVVSVPVGKTETTLANELLVTGDFSWVEPNYAITPDIDQVSSENYLNTSNDAAAWISESCAAVNSDPFFVNGDQWHHYWLKSCEAWSLFSGSSDITVCVVDSGVDPAHPDVNTPQRKEAIDMRWVTSVPGGIPAPSGWPWPAVDSDYRKESTLGPLGRVLDIAGHGMHCVGLAAAASNGVGCIGSGRGIGHRSINIAERVTTPGNSGFSTTTESVNAAIMYAADLGDKVISVSLRLTPGNFQSRKNAALYAKSKGSLVFQSAGNQGLNSAHPEAFRNESFSYVNSGMVLVGSLTRCGDSPGLALRRANYSAWGPGVALWAPGGGIPYPTTESLGPSHCPHVWTGILSIYPTQYGSYKQLAGTSMATPIAAGVAGLVWSRNPTLTPDEVYATLVNNADQISISGSDTIIYQVKVVNSYKSLLESAFPPPPPPPPPSPTTSPSSPLPPSENLEVAVAPVLVTTEPVVVGTTEIEKPKQPEDANPLHCEFPSRLAMTGFILDCLRQLFSRSSNLMHPQVKEFFWAAEATDNPLKAPYQVIIEDAFNFDINKAGIRPAVLVKAGPWQESKLVIGDNGMHGEIYHKRINGQHSVQIVAKSIAQAELLAREVQGYLSHFGPLLREYANLIKWEVPVLQEPNKLEEQAENVVISVNATYEIIYSWNLQPDTSRLIRQIVFNAIMNTNKET